MGTCCSYIRVKGSGATQKEALQALNTALQQYGTQVENTVAGYGLDGQPSSFYYFVRYHGLKEILYWHKSDNTYFVSVDLGVGSGEATPCVVQ